jgi:hypothetical protein
MRIRGIHIIFAGIVGVSLFVFIAITRSNSIDSRIDVDDPSFYTNVTEGPKPMGSGGGGLVPGVDDNPDLSPPKIEMPFETVDLGVLSSTEKSVREYMVKNGGDRPLVIRQVQTTCACTMGYFSESREQVSGPLVTIPPGQSRPLYIEIDPFKINGWEATKTLTIWSNDPAQPQVMVDVTSHIEPEFEFEDVAYDFGRVARGAKHTETFLLRQLTDEPFDVKGARATGNAVMPAGPGVSAASGGEMIPTFELRVIKRAKDQWKIADKAEWIIQVSLSPSLPDGTFNGYYEIETTSERLDRLHCSFEAQIVSFFRVVPEIITRRGGMRREGFKQGETEVGSATIMAESPFTVNITGIDGPWFHAEAVPVEGENSVMINVTVESEVTEGPKVAAVNMDIITEDGRTFEHTLSVVVRVNAPTN